MTRAVLHRWSDLTFEAMRGGIRRRFVTSGKMMIGEVRFSAGDVVPRHAHENEQFTWVVSGALHFWFGEEGEEEEITVRAGEIVVIPSNLPHRAEALEDTVEFDLFNPPRRDWIDGSDDYLRR
jgi:quercetin dioxygenase-like cupin family protein